MFDLKGHHDGGRRRRKESLTSSHFRWTIPDGRRQTSHPVNRPSSIVHFSRPRRAFLPSTINYQPSTNRVPAPHASRPAPTVVNKSAAICEGMSLVGGRPEKLREQLQDGRKPGHHQGLLAANQQAALREMLVDEPWSLISVSVNEHRRKAPTWGLPRIPECMSAPDPFPSACTTKK